MPRWVRRSLVILIYIGGFLAIIAELAAIFGPIVSDGFQHWIDHFIQLPHMAGRGAPTGMAENQIAAWYLMFMAMFLPITGLQQLLLGNPPFFSDSRGFSLGQVWLGNMVLAIIWIAYAGNGFFARSHPFLVIVMSILKIPLLLCSLIGGLLLLLSWGACGSHLENKTSRSS
jgi:hypothetical protein